jgi:putative transposase
MAFRKSPRLSTFQYRGAYAYSVTIVAACRRPVFRESVLVEGCVHHLGISARKYGFMVRAYCFMPDHLHLLVTGDEWSSLPDFARHFKQLTGYAYSRRTGRKLWQTSYWDHVLRAEEDIEVVARYVWGNPVRAGIVGDYRAYAGSGPRPLPDLI